MTLEEEDKTKKHCSDCGSMIKPRATRYLVYRHYLQNTLVARLCEKCANEDWKDGLLFARNY